MNQEEIITMAREVGFDDYEQDEMLRRFAALVAEKAAQDEREACAVLCEEREDYRGEHESAIRSRGR